MLSSNIPTSILYTNYISSRYRKRFHSEIVQPLILNILLILLCHIPMQGDCAPYCYDNPSCAPESWGQYSAVCQSGNFQSPINLQKSKAKVVAKSVNLVLSKEYAYVHSPFYLKNNGHSVRLSLDRNETHKCLVKGQGFLPNEPYFFSSLHFHWGPDDSGGSEHTIDEKHFPLELHMIHRQSSNRDKLAVFGILYQISQSDNPVLNPIIDNLYRVRNYNFSSWVSSSVNLTEFLPKKVKVFRYLGSLTTPTCDEGVIWTVFADIQPVSSRQVTAFRSLLQKNGRPMLRNYRPVQAAYTSQRKNIYYMKSIASKKRKSG